MDPQLKQQVARQRTLVRDSLQAQAAALAIRCLPVLGDRPALERILTAAMEELPFCKYLYALDASGRQLTANIGRQGVQEDELGRDRSNRPYFHRGDDDFQLSAAYISKNQRRPSLTAMQVIRAPSGEIVGFLGFDYDLRELPHADALHKVESRWTQVKGDPAIRGALFQQSRAESALDSRVDEVIALFTELMCCHGVFHGKLHFSSSRATVWLIDDPYSYRILDFDTLTDPDICLAYPKRDYFRDAVVPPEKIGAIFSLIRELRFADETIYLRAGSLNICNGMVAMNFSCDGSHYIPYDEFLKKDLRFWLGGN